MMGLNFGKLYLVDIKKLCNSLEQYEQYFNIKKQTITYKNFFI